MTTYILRLEANRVDIGTSRRVAAQGQSSNPARISPIAKGSGILCRLRVTADCGGSIHATRVQVGLKTNCDVSVARRAGTCKTTDGNVMVATYRCSRLITDGNGLVTDNIGARLIADGDMRVPVAGIVG